MGTHKVIYLNDAAQASVPKGIWRLRIGETVSRKVSYDVIPQLASLLLRIMYIM